MDVLTVTDVTPDAPVVHVAAEVVQRVGVAQSKALGFPVMFQRLTVKNSTKYRVWPVAGSDRHIDLDPSQWRERYSVVAEHKTDASGRPS